MTTYMVPLGEDETKRNSSYFFTFEIKPIDSEKLNASEIKYVENLNI